MPIGKIIDPNFAASAYNNISNVAKGGRTSGDDRAETGSAGSAGDPGGVSFSQFLENKVRESVDTLREGEKMSAKAVTGEADLTEVVEAVNAAEITLQTVVSVRDRMISAYQEIMRMPI